MMKKRSPEILAPAGSFESADAACCCGADAIYFGGTDFSARAGAENFTESDIEKLAKHCHLRGVAVHRALNTVVTDSEIPAFVETALNSARAGVDAFIVQDMGCVDILRKMLPDMPLHASTQMTIHTPAGALEARDMGFTRVVPARELSAAQIKAICDTGIETEVFVHGALCMCISGQCYMSAMIGSRSANRGRCAQACRLPFSGRQGERNGRYDLSLKDMSYIEHIPMLTKLGVSSLKIEGRMKRPEYVAAAVTACREMLNGNSPDMKSLEAVFSRSGFTDGYLTGKTGSGMFGYRRKEDVTSASEVLPSLAELYRREKPRYSMDMHAELRPGKPMILTASCGGITVSIEGAAPQKAINRPTDEQTVSRQLSKLGGTVYHAGDITVSADNDAAAAASALNELRRNAVSKMDEALISANTPVYPITGNIPVISYKTPAPAVMTPRIHIGSRAQLDAALHYGRYVIMPLEECLFSEICTDRIITAPPRFVNDEDALRRTLAQLREKGYSRLYCSNIAHIRLGRELGFTLSGGYGLNVTNSHSASRLAEMGLSDITLSFELKLPQIAEIKSPVPTAVAVYGRLPLMAVRNCPVRYASGCGNCTGKITDRTGRSFPVKCRGKNKDYAEVFNCDTLYMCDRYNEIQNVSYCDHFVTELSPGQTERELISCFEAKRSPQNITRGLYYRGVL